MMAKILRLAAYITVILFVSYKIAELRSHLFLAVGPVTLIAAIAARALIKPMRPTMRAHFTSLGTAGLISSIITSAIFWFASTYLAT